MKKLKLGLRFGKISEPDAFALTVQGNNLIQVYDVESGREITGVTNVEISYDINRGLEATMRFYPVAQDVINPHAGTVQLREPGQPA